MKPLGLLVTLLTFLVALAAGGCTSVGEACVVCCLFPKYWLEEQRKPKPALDTSTTHCATLAGAVYVAENGDRLAFDATQVRWTHDGTTETRAWRCETNRRVVLSGFDAEWKGTVHFEANGMARLHLQHFRNDDGRSTHVFPCERVPGRIYFAESGDSLAFLDVRTVRWTTASGVRTLPWSCAPGEISLHDGGDRIRIVLPASADLLRWDGVEWIHAASGARPAFPCDAIPGSTWRSPSGNEILSFVGPQEAKRTIDGVATDYLWECRGSKLRLRRHAQDPGVPFSLHQSRLHMSGGITYERVPP